MKTLAAFLLAIALSGCAIAERSDKFGADLELSVGGLLSYVVDLKLKASVGFSKTCPDKEGAGNDQAMANVGPGGGDRPRGFL